jgi:hypothetical protein
MTALKAAGQNKFKKKADMRYKIYESSYKGQKAIVMESDSLTFKFLPDFGGNIASIVDKKTSKEFMVQRPEPKYRTVWRFICGRGMLRS